MYAVVVAGLLFYFYRLDVRLTAFLAGTGFGAHLLEDALVYNPAFSGILALLFRGISGSESFPLYP